MLPAALRVRTPAEHRLVARRGRRGVSGPIAVRVLPGGSGERADAPARAGVVVPRAVGGAVARNLVKRRLRHLVVDRLVALPRGARLVVRAGSGSAPLSSAELGVCLDAALRSALRSAAPRGEAGGVA